MSSEEDDSFPFICEGPADTLKIFGESCGRSQHVSVGTGIFHKEEELEKLSCDKPSCKIESSIPIMEDSTYNSKDLASNDTKEESCETLKISENIVQSSDCLIKNNRDDVQEKVEDPDSSGKDESIIKDRIDDGKEKIDPASSGKVASIIKDCINDSEEERKDSDSPGGNESTINNSIDDGEEKMKKVYSSGADDSIINDSVDDGIINDSVDDSIINDSIDDSIIDSIDDVREEMIDPDSSGVDASMIKDCIDDMQEKRKYPDSSGGDESIFKDGIDDSKEKMKNSDSSGEDDSIITDSIDDSIIDSTGDVQEEIIGPDSSGIGASIIKDCIDDLKEKRKYPDSSGRDESIIQFGIDDVIKKRKDSDCSGQDESTIIDNSKKSKQKSKICGEGSDTLDVESLEVVDNSNFVTESQNVSSKLESYEINLIKGPLTLEEEIDCLERLTMDTISEIGEDLSSSSKQDLVSKTDSDVPSEKSNKDLNEEEVDICLDKGISSGIDVLNSSEFVSISKDLSNIEKKLSENSDSPSSLAKRGCDLNVEEDVNNTSEKVAQFMESKSENPDFLKKGNVDLSTTCEETSDNQTCANHEAIAAEGCNVLPVSGNDNFKQSPVKEPENITDKFKENMQIPICEQIPSDSGDPKGEKMMCTFSSGSPMNIKIDESISCDASCDLNKPEDFSSSDPSKLPSTEKETTIKCDDVKNYETEDDDLKVLEAFIVKSASNPEIAICYTKQSEDNIPKYSLESSLLDDLTKSDEVESVINVTKNERITPPESTIKNIYQCESTTNSLNSKLLISEELERASSEIASVLDNCPPPELKTKNRSTRRHIKPKLVCCGGQVSPLKKKLSHKKITNEYDEDMSKTKNLSKCLAPGTGKRARVRPLGLDKKVKVKDNLIVGKFQKNKRLEPKEGQETVEESLDTVRKEERSAEKEIAQDCSELKSLGKLQLPDKNTENSDSTVPLQFNTRKRKIKEIEGEYILLMDNVAKGDSSAMDNTNLLKGKQNILSLRNVIAEKEQVSTVPSSKTLKKHLLPGMKYPCMSVLTYDQLKSKAKEITLPSPLWSVQVDANGDRVLFLQAVSEISDSKFIIEKAIVFEKSLKPVFLVQNELINIPYSSLDNFEDVVLLIENFHNLQMCEGTAVKQRPYSKFCYKFVDIASASQRCSQCIEERRRVLFCYTKKLREKLTQLENL